MENLTVWLLPTLALVVGVIIGFLIARFSPGASAGNAQRQLEEMQARFATYQDEVVTHFNTTAGLMKKLTQSYQDMQKHLSTGASRLALDDATQQRLLAALDDQETLEKPAAEPSPATTEHMETPRDYAPKTDDGPGTLDESYGLKK